MTSETSDSRTHLRLIWPQWQGAGSTSVAELATPEFPYDIARCGYTIGTRVLRAILPEHEGPTVEVPVEMSDVGLATPSTSGITCPVPYYRALSDSWN